MIDAFIYCQRAIVKRVGEISIFPSKAGAISIVEILLLDGYMWIWVTCDQYAFREVVCVRAGLVLDVENYHAGLCKRNCRILQIYLNTLCLATGGGINVP
jgi:hypothetical protein